MNMKKVFVFGGSLLILGFGLLFAGEKSKPKYRQEVQNRNQIRIMFIDENGDGICDAYRDHDNDGIPNGQDPDWAKQKDGSGYQNRYGQADSPGKYQNRKVLRQGNWGENSSFRYNRQNFGSGVCLGLGPKGNAAKRGKH